MKWTKFVRAKSVCAYFFLGPGLLYGLFTSRFPALKAQTQAHEAEIGFILLALGVAALFGMVVSPALIRRFSSRRVIRVSSLCLLATLPMAACAGSPLSLGLVAALMGLFTGLMDVSMNAQAIQLEQRFAAPCLALMHASYSFGGFLGALTGAIFAALSIAPLMHYAVILVCYLLPWLRASARLQKDRVIRYREGEEVATPPRRMGLPPVHVIMLGLLAACVYAAEGSVGEWGALYLFTVKGASEQTAALVYACFAVSTLLCRLFADSARTVFSEFSIVLVGGLLGVTGMSIVLHADHTAICLAGYACMGLGMAPLVPLCFSRAGRVPGVAPSQASSIVSIFAYGGLLLFPPLIGTVAHAHGLGRALHIALALTILMTIGSILFSSRR